MKPKILTFGEIIWDIYDDGRYIGGAGLNFAAHCARCGANSFIMSAVGNDELADETIEAISSFGIDKSFLKTSDRNTGRCLVELDEKGAPAFNVLTDAAYDNIIVNDDDISKINAMNFDAVYFGTLIQRKRVSRGSLRKICNECCFDEIVCDINLRKNCYDTDSVLFCLENATILKISSEEEPQLAQFGLYTTKENSVQAVSQAICERFPQIKYLITTLGDKGSYVYCACEKKGVSQKAESVAVASTVGAGDSYIAAWATSYLSGESVDASTRRASELSGYVVSKKGAIPDYHFENGVLIADE